MKGAAAHDCTEASSGRVPAVPLGGLISDAISCNPGLKPPQAVRSLESQVNERRCSTTPSASAVHGDAAPQSAHAPSMQCRHPFEGDVHHMAVNFALRDAMAMSAPGKSKVSSVPPLSCVLGREPDTVPQAVTETVNHLDMILSHVQPFTPAGLFSEARLQAPVAYLPPFAQLYNHLHWNRRRQLLHNKQWLQSFS